METEFLNIIEKNQGIIFKVCRMYRDSQEDQDDLFQEIVLQLWKAYPKFRKESKVSTWMYRIAINTGIAIYRARKVKLEFTNHLSPSHNLCSPGDISENEERLFEAIRTLTKSDRALIALYLEDYSYREIGQVIGISENYVGVKISRIKEKLKTTISKQQ